MSLNSKILNTYKQFGFFYFVKGFFKRLIAPIVKMTSFYIVTVENHIPEKYKGEIIIVDVNNLENFLSSDINLSEDLERQLGSFIPQNTIAIIIIKDNNIASWGFVQQSGMSKYGGYDYNLPKGVHLLKNLYVEPNYRGQSMGKHINEARISCIPKAAIPTGFVIPSNKFAIRNLEMYGFSKQVFVKDCLWFNIYHTRSLKVLGNKDMANLIISGFKNE